METAVRWFTTGLVVAHEKTSNPRERSPYSFDHQARTGTTRNTGGAEGGQAVMTVIRV